MMAQSMLTDITVARRLQALSIVSSLTILYFSDGSPILLKALLTLALFRKAGYAQRHTWSTHVNFFLSVGHRRFFQKVSHRSTVRR